jgi:hypothetical protein
MPGLDPGIHDEAPRLRASRSASQARQWPWGKGWLCLSPPHPEEHRHQRVTRVFDALWRCGSKDGAAAWFETPASLRYGGLLGMRPGEAAVVSPSISGRLGGSQKRTTLKFLLGLLTQIRS